MKLGSVNTADKVQTNTCALLKKKERLCLHVGDTHTEASGGGCDGFAPIYNLRLAGASLTHGGVTLNCVPHCQVNRQFCSVSTFKSSAIKIDARARTHAHAPQPSATCTALNEGAVCGFSVGSKNWCRSVVVFCSQEFVQVVLVCKGTNLGGVSVCVCVTFRSRRGCQSPRISLTSSQTPVEQHK